MVSRWEQVLGVRYPPTPQGYCPGLTVFESLGYRRRWPPNISFHWGCVQIFHNKGVRAVCAAGEQGVYCARFRLSVPRFPVFQLPEFLYRAYAKPECIQESPGLKPPLSPALFRGLKAAAAPVLRKPYLFLLSMFLPPIFRIAGWKGCLSRRFLLLNEEDRGDQGLTRRVCRDFEGNYFWVGVSGLICGVCGGEETRRSRRSRRFRRGGASQA
jgi:hypothetical protein